MIYRLVRSLSQFHSEHLLDEICQFHVWADVCSELWICPEKHKAVESLHQDSSLVQFVDV